MYKLTDTSADIIIRVRLSVQCLCSSRITVDGNHIVSAVSLHHHLMLSQITVLYHTVRNVYRILAVLVIIGGRFSKLLHLILKFVHLSLYLFGTIVDVNIVGEYRLPFISNRIILQPQITHTNKVARMVEGKVQELLLHEFVAVSLHNGTLGHGL